MRYSSSSLFPTSWIYKSEVLERETLCRTASSPTILGNNRIIRNSYRIPHVSCLNPSRRIRCWVKRVWRTVCMSSNTPAQCRVSWNVTSDCLCLRGMSMEGKICPGTFTWIKKKTKNGGEGGKCKNPLKNTNKNFWHHLFQFLYTRWFPFHVQFIYHIVCLWYSFP